MKYDGLIRRYSNCLTKKIFKAEKLFSFICVYMIAIFTGAKFDCKARQVRLVAFFCGEDQ